MPSEPLTLIFEIEAIEFKGKSIYVPAMGEKDVEWERFLCYNATYKLEYDELTKEIDHTIAKNDVIDASVELPNRGNTSWVPGDGGNLTGPPVRIDTTQVSNIFMNSDITNNDSVNESGTSVVRSTHLEASLEREKFGDKPLANGYLNLAKPKDLLRRRLEEAQKQLTLMKSK